MRQEIMAYYQRGQERHRITSGHGRLEYVRTWDVLTRVLPAPPATVLDVGGATGVYAGPLAGAGYGWWLQRSAGTHRCSTDSSRAT